MARPKDQDHQRAHVTAAARRAIVKHGLARVRIRDIADAAGMSPGTVTYYYRHLDDLFQQVFEDAADRFHRQRAHAVEQHIDHARKLAAAIDAGLPHGADDELCCLLYEFSPRARRRPDHAALRRSLYDRRPNCTRISSTPAATRAPSLSLYPLRKPPATSSHWRMPMATTSSPAPPSPPSRPAPTCSDTPATRPTEST
ncbi:TetR family transcriptional regulator [Micromonospora sp. WMMB482]|nr:TetR family transcriptional regulator [Micromonospora sp. WMMB482]